MRVFVFVGPTLPVAEARRELDATYLPPATQGDVYAAARERPWAIGLIDGYFERVPAVWHKEILWAMSQGVHVFGAASMGALRAAELWPHGMEGVGVVFRAYRDGTLEDDDEVTLIHGPVEAGFVALSEPMVNIRFTLDAAQQAGVLDETTGRRLIKLAKSLFYPQRTYERLLQMGRALGLPIAALEAWLPGGRVNRKRLDALEMLREMRARQEAGPQAKRVSYHFQHTDAWEQVRRQIDRRPLDAAAGSDRQQHDALHDELRLDPARCQEQRRQALIRSLALEISTQGQDEAGDALLRETVDQLRREQGLDTPESVARWLQDQALSEHDFARLAATEARVRRVLMLFEPDLNRQLPDQLRWQGEYAELADRAREKQRLLARHGLENPTLADTGLSEEGLWQWYFDEYLTMARPPRLAAWAQELGYPGLHALRRTVLREYLYLQRAPAHPISSRLSSEETRQTHERTRPYSTDPGDL